MRVYERIRAAQEATAMTQRCTEQYLKYCRVLPTGACELHDYGARFLYIEAIALPRPGDGYGARIYVGNIDDGEIEGEITGLSKDDAMALISRIAHNVILALDSMPSQVELNKLLEPYGITVARPY